MTYDPEVPAEVRAAFAAGPGPEPALRLSAEDTLARGRRALRRRRVVGTGAGALAVTAVLGAAAVVPRLPAEDPTAGVSTATTAPAGPTAPVTGSAPTRTPGTPRPPETVARRLTAALKASVRPAPGGVLLPSSPLRPGLAGLEVVASQGGYKAVVDERDPLGSGSLFVWVTASDGAPRSDPCGQLPRCTSRTTAAGDVAVSAIENDGTGVVVNVVEVHRSDGTYVELRAANHLFADTPPGAPSRPARAAPPWTTEQLVAVGVDPDLRVS